MSVEDLKALGRHFFEELNKGKTAALAVMDEVYATDFVGHGGGGEEIRGLEEFKGYMNEVFNAFPDIHFTIHDLVVEGDKGVTRLTWTGTHKGEMRGSPPPIRR